jgi:hypothetical protein
LKLFLSLFFAIAMLSANGLLFLSLFNREYRLKWWKGLFIGKEFLLMLMYNLIQLLPFLTAAFYKPHIFIDHGPSGFVYVVSGLVYPLLCLTIIPYQIIFRRDYSLRTKVLGILFCFLSLIISVLALAGGVDFQFKN